MSNDVLFAYENAIVTLTLNRPKNGNTVNLSIARSLLSAVHKIEKMPSVRCIILTGAGKLFCGGGDLLEMVKSSDNISDYLDELATTLHAAILGLHNLKIPIVGIINGPAAGAGFSLAILPDIVLSSDTAHFTAAYTQVGLSPDGGLSWLLPKITGLRKAQEIILTNQRISAKAALEIGLVSRVVALDDLQDEGRKIADNIVNSAVGAVGHAKTLLLTSYQNSLEQQLKCEVSTIVKASASQEARDGISAFIARQKPKFYKE